MRISNIDPVRAQREAESAMAHPAGLMNSQEDKMATVPNYAPVALRGENQGGNENEVVNCSFRYGVAMISIQGLASGTYLVRSFGDSGICTKKVIVK